MDSESQNESYESYYFRQIAEICQEAFHGEERIGWHESGPILATTLERHRESGVENKESCVSLRRVVIRGFSGLEPGARGSATVIGLGKTAPVISWLCKQLAADVSEINGSDKIELLSSISKLLESIQEQDELQKQFDNMMG